MIASSISRAAVLAIQGTLTFPNVTSRHTLQHIRPASTRDPALLPQLLYSAPAALRLHRVHGDSVAVRE